MLVPFLLGLLNTYLTLNSLSILAILSKYFEFRFTFCAHFRNLEGLEGFHSLCLQHLANTGAHRLSILTNFHFIARKPATSKTLNFHFNEFPFHRECTVYPLCLIQWACTFHRGLFTCLYLGHFTTFSRVWWILATIEVLLSSKLVQLSPPISDKWEKWSKKLLSVWPDATFVYIWFALRFLSFPPLQTATNAPKSWST